MTDGKTGGIKRCISNIVCVKVHNLTTWWSKKTLLHIANKIKECATKALGVDIKASLNQGNRSIDLSLRKSRDVQLLALCARRNCANHSIVRAGKILSVTAYSD
jgi:hypothetical protein